MSHFSLPMKRTEDPPASLPQEALSFVRDQLEIALVEIALDDEDIFSGFIPGEGQQLVLPEDVKGETKKPLKVTLKLSVNHEIAFDMFVEEDEPGFHGFVPCMKGLHVDGKTIQETLRLILEGLQVYVGSLKLHGHALSSGPGLELKAHQQLDLETGFTLRSLP